MWFKLHDKLILWSFYVFILHSVLFWTALHLLYLILWLHYLFDASKWGIYINEFLVIRLKQSDKAFCHQKQPPRGLSRKGILKICSKFTGEHPCRSVISIKLLCNFLKITLQHGCSPINLLHIFRTPFLTNTSGRLLLYH